MRAVRCAGHRMIDLCIPLTIRDAGCTIGEMRNVVNVTLRGRHSDRFAGSSAMGARSSNTDSSPHLHFQHPGNSEL